MRLTNVSVDISELIEHIRIAMKIVMEQEFEDELDPEKFIEWDEDGA